MRNKKILVMILILVIIVGIVIINRIDKNKLEYELKIIEGYNYFKYNEDSKFGIIDRDGNIIIEPIYKNIDIPNPEEGIFICKNDEKNIVLNSNKEELFSNYDNVETIRLKNLATTLCFEKSVLKYKKDGMYGLINFAGKELTKNIYSSIENLESTEGKLLVCKDGKYGVINIKGNTIVDIKYDGIKSDGYYRENTGNKDAGFIVSNTTEEGYRYGYVNSKGKKVLEPKYGEINRIAGLDEIYLIVSENGKYGLYCKSKEVIKPEYQLISYEENGALIIEKNQSFGIANLKGDIKVEPNYSKIELKGIYLYAQNSNNNQIFDSDGNKIDMNFNKVIYETGNAEYRITTLLNNDIIYYGIENNEGTSLVNEGYRYLEYLFKDYFIAKDDSGNLGVINSNGKVIIELKYDSVQKIKDKNVIQTLMTEKQETEIYSSDLSNSVTMTNAVIENENGYIKIYNDDEIFYLDNEGKRIKKDSEEIQDDIKDVMPNKIGELKKIQNYLDDVYYSK